MDNGMSGRGMLEVNGTDVITLGGTLLTSGSNAKQNGYAMSEGPKEIGASSHRELSDRPRSRTIRHENYEHEDGQLYNQDSHRIHQDQVLSFKDLNQYAERNENQK